MLLDGRLVQATHRTELNSIPLFATRENTAHIFPHIESGVIISVGKLFDDGCTAIFTATHMKVEKKCNMVLESNRKIVAGM